MERTVNKAGQFDRPQTVYRGLGRVSAGGATNQEFADRLRSQVGKTIRMKGLQSTTTDPGIAAGFANASPTDPGIMFEISTRRGAPLGGLAGAKREKEILLGHNWKYRVKSVDQSSVRSRRLGRSVPIHLVRLEVV